MNPIQEKDWAEESWHGHTGKCRHRLPAESASLAGLALVAQFVRRIQAIF